MKSKTGVTDSSLKRRMKRSYESRDNAGANRPQVFNWSKVKDIKFYKPVKRNRINIIPYNIKTKNDPLVRSGDFKVGEAVYVFDYFVHPYMGAKKADILCPKLTFNGKCPICEQREALRERGKKDAAAALWPKRKCAYNVIDANNPDEGMQVFVASHFLFEKELIEASAEATDNPEEMLDFSNIKRGRVVNFRTSEATMVDTKTGKKSKYPKFKDFSFEKREEPLDPAIIKQAISFDEIANILSAKEITELLYSDDENEGDDVDEDEEEDEEDEGVSSRSKKTARNHKKAKDSEDEEDDEEDEEDDEETEDDEDGDDDSDTDDSDDSDSDDSDDEDEETEDDEDGDDDETEDDSKKSSKKGSSASSKKAGKTAKGEVKATCPHKHTFGADCDTEDECEACKKWTDCRALKDKNRKRK